MGTERRAFIAYTLPFAVFMAFVGANSALGAIFKGSDHFMLSHPHYWTYPLQTAVCAGVLLYFRKSYPRLSSKAWLIAVLAGICAFILWVSPQAFFGAPERTNGFDPSVFEGSAVLHGLITGARFARLVIVVPVLEEIFWRGFLMRYLINESFNSITIGTFRPFSFFSVAVLFMLAHSSADWIPALLTGFLLNGVAVRTKSLWACIIAHATTNFGLGAYIMATKQWGFW